MAPTVSNIVVGLATDNTVKAGLYGTVEGSCTELGLTEGGIEISNVREYFERKADQYIGVLGVDKISERPTVKFAIAEATLDNEREVIKELQVLKAKHKPKPTWIEKLMGYDILNITIRDKKRGYK